jgi:hypothetical protein
MSCRLPWVRLSFRVPAAGGLQGDVIDQANANADAEAELQIRLHQTDCRLLRAIEEADEQKRQWTGLDVPDFNRDKPPDYKPPEGAAGDAALAGDQPFILHPDGVAWLFVSIGLKDGPLPTHYEPLESPVSNPL